MPMNKKFLAALIVVVVIIVAFLLICPAVFKDLFFLPQEVKDNINSDTVSQVPIEWQ